MRNIYIYIIFYLLLSTNVVAQTTYTWGGGATGDYQIATNWIPIRNTLSTTDILLFNAAIAIELSNVPNQTIGAIEITGGTSSIVFSSNSPTNVLTISSPIPILYLSAGSLLVGDVLTIRLSNTAIFTMSTGTLGISPNTGGKIIIDNAMVLNGGKLDFDVPGTGGTIINGSITYLTGIFNCANASAIIWSASATYFHAFGGTATSTVPASSWTTGSTCTITGMNGGIIPPSILDGTSFSNFTWNCATQLGDVNLILPLNTLDIYGTLSIVNTNNKHLRLSNAVIATNTYTQTGGYFMLQSGNATSALTVNGAFIHSGGTLDGVGNAATGSAVLFLRGNVTKSNTSVWMTSSSSTSAQTNIEFSGIISQIVSIGGTWSNPDAGRSNIAITNTSSAGVLLLANSVLHVFNRNSNIAATCRIAGLLTPTNTTSFIRYTGTTIANPTTLIYSGLLLQTATPAEFPNSNGPNNLTIDIANILGVAFPPSFNRTIPGTLTLNGDNLDIGEGNSLSLTNPILANQLSYTRGFISSGTLVRSYAINELPTSAGSSSLFPMGTGANNRSLNIFFNTNTATAGTIAITHTTSVLVSAVSPVIPDNGIDVDKRTGTKWIISTTGFAGAAATVSITAAASNIGAIDLLESLRLTDGATTDFGTLIVTTGTTANPIVGKSGLPFSSINSKDFFIGSNGTTVFNPLQIITFTWTGLGGNTNWTNANNWSAPTTVGFPSASTEIAIINTTSGTQPTINSGDNINIYRLIVGSGMTLTMSSNAIINVFDEVNYTGNTPVFSPASTFIYTQSGGTQTLVDLPYGNLSIAGTAAKLFPAIIRVKGIYKINGAAPNVITNLNTFIFEGTGSQFVPPGNYYNLTITGNRSGTEIKMGLPNNSSSNRIDIGNVFDVRTLTNYSNPPITPWLSFTDVNFSSNSPQIIPGFRYPNIVYSIGTGSRTLDPLGASNINHVIYCRLFIRQPGTTYTVTGSKVNFYSVGVRDPIIYSLHNQQFNDLEFSGDQLGKKMQVDNGNVFIIGNLTVSLVNYKQVIGDTYFIFNGSLDQTIPAFKTNTATNTPAFKYSNIIITGNNRNVTLGGAGVDTIGIQGVLQVPGLSVTNPQPIWGGSVINNPFSAGKGFIVDGSTVNFSTGSSPIPILYPAAGNTKNYQNVVLSSGTRQIGINDITIGGNLSVGMDSSTVTASSSATLKIGSGGNTSTTLNVLGNLSIRGNTTVSSTIGQLDLNPGTTLTALTTLNLGGNLSITGNGQLMGTTSTGTNNGRVIFNGTLPQTYTNTSTFNNGMVNFTVGNGTISSRLILGSSLNLLASSTPANKSTLTVADKSSLNCGTNNIISNGTGDAIFNLNTGATFITANTGGIEGVANSSATGTIINSTTVSKLYNAGANYIFNGSTTTPFPAAIGTMANLTTNANVTLNRAIISTDTLNLVASTLTQNGNNLQFSGLTSTTGNIFADKNASITILGSVGTVGTLRFASGGNTTGQFNIDRGVTIPLGSDLIIEKTPLSGNFISGASSSILDINGNTLTINGAITGSGFLRGSRTSNLLLGGTAPAGTIKFATSGQVLKNLTLLNSVSAILGTPLDIAAGVVADTAGTVSVLGTAVLASAGNLIIKSNEFGTARVNTGAITGAYLTGDVTVERYLSSRRAWRFLAAPTAGQTIKASWQEGQAPLVNPGTGFGAIITSNLANAISLGFDAQSPSASLIKYNSTTSAWSGVPNTLGQIAASNANNAYMLFSRGDRSVPLGVGVLPTTVLLRTKGSLFQGDLPTITVAAGKYEAIGNNYASAIDFSLLGKINIDESFSLYDPKLNTLGGWAFFAGVNSWKPLIPGGTYDINKPNQKIESGQAFMVHNTTGSNGTVTLKESSKVTQSRLVSRPSGSSRVRQSFKTSLYNTASVNDNNMIDANLVVFADEYSNTIDGKDVTKMANFAENFGIQKPNNKVLVIEAKQPIAINDTIFYNMNRLKRQNYRLEFTAENFNNDLVAYLEDKYLDDLIPLEINGISSVDFTVNTDPVSAVADRFRVVFQKTIPLPVTIKSLTAIQKINDIAVQWSVENEINITKYDIEKSTDGVSFTKIGSINATALNGNNSKVYNFLDEKALPGKNFYRLRIFNQSGKQEFSRIVLVKIGNLNNGIIVYPNPINGNSMGVLINNMEEGLYQFKLVNTLGQTLLTTQINHNNSSSTQSIALKNKLTPGIYQLEVISPAYNRSSIKVIVK